MKKYQKPLLFLIILALFSTATYTLYRYIAVSVVREINLSVIKRDVSVVESAFYSRIETLTQLNKDWAQWDDSYTFVQDLNEEFIAGNLILESLQTANLNLLLYFDEDGYIVHKLAGSLGGLGDTAIPTEISNYTTVNNKIDINKVISSGEQNTGFLATTSGTFMYAVNPITKSSGEGPAKGALMMARYINKSDLEELKKTTGYNIEFIQPTDLGNKFYKNISMDQLKNGPLIIEQPNKFNVYLLVNDSWGNPAKVLNFEYQLEWLDYAYRYSALAALLTIVLSGSFGLAVLSTLPKIKFAEKVTQIN